MSRAGIKSLLSVDDLASLIEERDLDLVILEAGSGHADSHLGRGHVPGAIWVNLEDLEADTDASPRRFWRLVDDRALERAIHRLGISKDTTVVVYSHSILPAARLAVALLYAGVEDVRILEGGLQAWRAEGELIAAHPSAPRPPRQFGTKIPAHPEYLITTQELRARIADPKYQIADVRSLGEFEGRASGYSYVAKAGRISGAIWAHGGPSAHRLEEYGDGRGGWRSAREVEAMWAGEGIERERPVSFYCGTGWRASVAFLYALWLGWKDVSLYDGGWFLWSEGPDASLNPIARSKSVALSTRAADASAGEA